MRRSRSLAFIAKANDSHRYSKRAVATQTIFDDPLESLSYNFVIPTVRYYPVEMDSLPLFHFDTALRPSQSVGPAPESPTCAFLLGTIVSFALDKLELGQHSV